MRQNFELDIIRVEVNWVRRAISFNLIEQKFLSELDFIILRSLFYESDRAREFWTLINYFIYGGWVSKVILKDLTEI